MSLKHGFLAQLAEGPTFGYQLKKGFERFTAGVWPINDGQVYTTLQRLERDGLVAMEEVHGQRSYSLTEAGRDELERWFDTPRPVTLPERDELTIKIAFALDHPEVVSPSRLLSLVEAQRSALTAALQELTRHKARLGDDEVAQAAVLDATAVRFDGELRWLGLVEERVRARRGRGRRSTER